MYIDPKSKKMKWWATLKLATLSHSSEWSIEKAFEKHGDDPIKIVDEVTYKPMNVCQFYRQAYIAPFINGMINGGLIAWILVTVLYIVYSVVKFMFVVAVTSWASILAALAIAIVIGVLILAAFKYVFIPATIKLANSRAVSKIGEVHDNTICKEITYVESETK